MRNGRGTIGLEEEEKKENILLSLQIAVKFHRIIIIFFFYHDEYLASNPDCRVNMYVPVDRTSVPLLI